MKTDIRKSLTMAPLSYDELQMLKKYNKIFFVNSTSLMLAKHNHKVSILPLKVGQLP